MKPNKQIDETQGTHSKWALVSMWFSRTIQSKGTWTLKLPLTMGHPKMLVGNTPPPLIFQSRFFRGQAGGTQQPFGWHADPKGPTWATAGL